MDKYTSESIAKVLKALDRVNGNLGHLVSFVSEQREKEKQSISPKEDPTQKDYAAVGKVFISTYGRPPEDNTETPKSKWYRRIQRSKPGLESVGIVFAIIYAVVTYLQWQDLRHNFFVEQKSWAKYQILWPEILTPDSKVGVIITNTGKIPILSSEIVGSIAVIPDDRAALMPDGNHPTMINYHSFLFQNDHFPYIANLYDEQSMKVRDFTDSELRELSAGRSYIAIFGFMKYRDELGDHWLRFCDWHNYAPNSVSNASHCVWMNKSGDGTPPKGKPSDHANPWQK